jgi:hypothetical protein
MTPLAYRIGNFEITDAMAKHKPTDESEALRPGWAPERKPLDEKPAPTLNTQGFVNSWTAKASARSGPKFAPGTGVKPR